MKEENKVISIQEGYFRKLDNANYWNTLEEFECLKIKVMMDRDYTPGEASKFVSLLKYFSDKGHSESFQMFCKSLYKKVLKGEPL